MTAKSLLVTLFVASLVVVCGAAAQKDVTGAHCGAEFQATPVGGGMMTGYLLHRREVIDNTETAVRIDVVDLVVEVPIPNKLEGFDTLSNALDQSFIVEFSRGRGNIYATCEFYASRAIGFSDKLSFAMRIKDDDGKITRHGGVCDVEPWTPGVQAGVPDMWEGDRVIACIRVNGQMVDISTGRIVAY